MRKRSDCTNDGSPEMPRDTADATRVRVVSRIKDRDLKEAHTAGAQWGLLRSHREEMYDVFHRTENLHRADVRFAYQYLREIADITQLRQVTRKFTVDDDHIWNIDEPELIALIHTCESVVHPIRNRIVQLLESVVKMHGWHPGALVRDEVHDLSPLFPPYKPVVPYRFDSPVADRIAAEYPELPIISHESALLAQSADTRMGSLNVPAESASAPVEPVKQSEQRAAARMHAARSPRKSPRSRK